MISTPAGQCAEAKVNRHDSVHTSMQQTAKLSDMLQPCFVVLTHALSC